MFSGKGGVHLKKTGTIISCGISTVLFLFFLVKGDISHALLILLLIFGVITGQLICTSKDKTLNICSFVIVLLCSFMFGIYSLIGGNTVTGVLSFMAIVFSAFGFVMKKQKVIKLEIKTQEVSL